MCLRRFVPKAAVSKRSTPALIRSPRRRGASSVGGTSRPVLHFARDQKVFHRPPDWVDLVVVVVGWWRTIVSPRRNVVWRGGGIVGRGVRGMRGGEGGRGGGGRGRGGWWAGKAIE